MKWKNGLDILWCERIEEYRSFVNESRRTILHPKIGEIIKGSNRRILEYGCGDGSLIEVITKNKNNEISIYDVSEKALDFTRSVLPEPKPYIFKEIQEIYENYFDYVIFSLVLVTMKRKSDIKTVLKAIHGFLKKDGILIFASTHPCFRQNYFSTFHTSYSENQNFDYLNEGEKFRVTIVDNDNKKKLSFFDYHWSLSFTINSLLEANLNVSNVIELPDIVNAQKQSNKSHCPYIIIQCQKV